MQNAMEDLAAKKAVQASTDEENRANNLTDGTGSEWWTVSTEKQWLIIDLGETPVSVSEVKIQWWGDYGAKTAVAIDFVSESRQDLCDWSGRRETAAEFNGWTTIEVPRNVTAAEVSHRYVRVRLDNPQLDCFGLKKQYGIRQIRVTGTKDVKDSATAEGYATAPVPVASEANIEEHSPNQDQLKLLKHEDPVERLCACKYLGQVGSPQDPGAQTEVLPGLMTMLEDEDFMVRAAAMEALAEVAYPGDKAVLAAATKMLQDEDDSVRRTACDTLAKVGKPGDKDVLASLIKMVEEDKEEEVKGGACGALAKVADKGSNDVLAALTLKLKDESSLVRECACRALGKVAQKGDENAEPSNELYDAIDELTKLLSDTENTIKGLPEAQSGCEIAVKKAAEEALSKAATAYNVREWAIHGSAKEALHKGI